MIGEQWAKLGTALLKLLGALGLYRAGRKAARVDQMEDENAARKAQAKAAADSSNLDPDVLADRVRKEF